MYKSHAAETICYLRQFRPSKHGINAEGRKRWEKKAFCCVLLKYLVIAVSNFTARQKLS